MEIWFNPARELDRALRAAAADAPGFGADFAPEVRPADPRHGDYQANGVLPFAKARKQNPRALAVELLEAVRAGGALDPALVEISIAGPGFVNFRFTPEFLLKWLEKFAPEKKPSGASGRGVCMDYPSLNVAKQSHIGHLRPMVIGEAVSRVLEFSGATVTRDNHIGDWGTNFGVMILELKESGEQLAEDPVVALDQLDRIYKNGAAKARDKDGPWTRAAREELVKLQNGDPENTRLWEGIVELSNRAADAIYRKLGVTTQLTLGESFYRDKVDFIYRELTECGLAVESEGALVVFHPEHPRFKEQPFIIRKSDGASNYASTDLATVYHRVFTLHCGEILYVTDDRQRDHFEQLFLTVEKWFRARGWPVPRMRHLWFGKILGADGKAIKTKSGESLKLLNVLDEAEARVRAIVEEKNPGLSEVEKANIARVVGLGAVKYADLRQDRVSDYEFSWEKMLALDGNTAPYLLYAVARLHSIFRKAGLPVDDPARDARADAFDTPAEIALARKLLRFPAELDSALADLRPHFLCTYLHELAGEFSTFYAADQVLGGAAPVEARRLLLCSRALRVLETGLRLLGLETLERM